MTLQQEAERSDRMLRVHGRAGAEDGVPLDAAG